MLMLTFLFPLRLARAIHVPCNYRPHLPINRNLRAATMEIITTAVAGQPGCCYRWQYRPRDVYSGTSQTLMSLLVARATADLSASYAYDDM
jgi:hypothetical protein